MNGAVKNYFSTLFFILITYSFYSSLKYYQDFFAGDFSFLPLGNFSFTMPQLFLVIVILYSLGLIPFYIYHKGKSKALLVIEYFIHKLKDIFYTPSKEETVAVLAWGVKMFFAPLMIYWFMDHLLFIVNTGYFVILEKNSTDFITFFNSYGFWLAFNAIFFIDVFFFTCGYLFESPYLKNTIRSVEPTIFGWVVCIMCYPPFNSYVTSAIGWYSQDFPGFETPYIHLSLNIFLLFLLCIYSWASISLGWKASNLTNRGIVTHGPYKYIRHPAYLTKNLAWWIGAIPMVLLSFSNNDPALLGWILVGTLGWSSIYVLRAITEERHLSLDPEYREYKKKVRYRFIPRVW